MYTTVISSARGTTVTKADGPQTRRKARRNSFKFSRDKGSVSDRARFVRNVNVAEYSSTRRHQYASILPPRPRLT